VLGGVVVRKVGALLAALSVVVSATAEVALLKAKCRAENAAIEVSATAEWKAVDAATEVSATAEWRAVDAAGRRK
jgi:hypothetical protein